MKFNSVEESTEYKLKEVQVIVAHLTNIEKMKYTWRSAR